MYLAPLNYDRFFKKVFSDPKIAKRFLEDFLDITITEITRLKHRHRVTDDASVVEFDYRCTIDSGEYFIIDMQQWYKTDVVHRFYVYHALNSALQLEHLPVKSLLYGNKPEKVKDLKDYRKIGPVFTIIWMVDDCLGFKDDYVSSAMTPKVVVEFIRNKQLWTDPDLLEIIRKRENILETLDNKTKGFDFLSKNELVFVFQPNIVKNESLSTSAKKYAKWFEFATMTRDETNNSCDFDKFRGDDIFEEMIRRLQVNDMPAEDRDYIKMESELQDKIKRYEDGVREESRQEAFEEGFEEGVEKGFEKGVEEGVEKGVEKGRDKEKTETVLKMHKAGINQQNISDITGKSIEEIKDILKPH